MNKIIIRFLEKQTCATICCVDEQGKPWCFSCFYALRLEEGLLYFKSADDSHHSALMKKNSLVAGTILPDKLNTFLVKGVQFEGTVLASNHPMAGQASGNYHKRHPISLAIPGEMWTIKINHIKMTDSTKGFGKKIIWNRKEEEIMIKDQ